MEVSNKNTYYCIFCSSNFVSVSNFNKHCSSLRHIDNKNNSFYCKACNYITKYSAQFNRHFKTKIHKKNVSDITNEDISESNINPLINIINPSLNKNTNILTELKELNKKIKKIEKVKISETKIKKLIKDGIDDSKLAKTSKELNNKIKNIEDVKISETKIKQLIRDGIDDSKLAKTSNALYKILNTKHLSNPPLLSLNDYTSQILLTQKFNSKLNDDNNYVEKAIIKSYINKRLVDDLVDLILDQVKSSDTMKQSVFVSDMSRLTYLIKLTMKDWLSDKKGNKFTEQVIQPLMDTIKIRVRDYAIELDPEDFDDNLDFLTYSNHIGELIKELNKNVLTKEILTKISPNLQYQ